MVKKLDLATKRNVQFLCITILLSIAVIAYGQSLWLSEAKDDYLAQMTQITEYLVQEVSSEDFDEIVIRQGAVGKSVNEQVMAINNEIQPLLNHMLVSGKCIKYGIYSRQHERIVAIGPDFDRSLLSESDPATSLFLYETQQTYSSETTNSHIWYGAPSLCHRNPIIYNGVVIGYAFATVNLNKVYSEAWKRLVNAFLGVIIALLAIIILFQEAFIRLKKDLRLFAEKIVEGKGHDFESELPEFTPIFKYISEQTGKMAQLDRLNTIGEMAASIGHEVRNPMTTVRGYLQYMSGKPCFLDQKENLQLMMDELDRANNIITEFLSLAKNHIMDFKEDNLNQVIIDILPLIQADALRNNCQIKATFGEVQKIVLDSKSLRQLILNMVRNGIEAMPKGGTVEIQTSQLEKKVLLTIRDQGIGIPLDMISKLGTPFLTTKETGTGLGLSVCYRIAQRHGASITVESQAGKGTVFTIGFNAV